ncbi:hypothetical protein ABWK22_02265 [Gottfriedia acidiceleris]|uniref:hypothetical protein n=1 Tax=Gottfriedia acidiceleris TaxID=371036 RepID=UPI00339B555D
MKKTKGIKEFLRDKPFAFYGIYLWGLFLAIDSLVVAIQIGNHEFKLFGHSTWSVMFDFVFWMYFQIKWQRYQKAMKKKEEDK